jgi:hypothetical protein
MQIVYSLKLIYIYLKKQQNIYSQLQRATETNVNLLLEKMLMVKVRLFNYRNILGFLYIEIITWPFSYQIADQP